MPGPIPNKEPDRRTRGEGIAHSERRREIGDALLRLISTQGLDAVSLRQVATEAGVSTGRVQHYFGTKDQMLAFAFEHINDRGTALVQQQVAADSSPRAVLRAIAVELLPIDEEHRESLRIASAFTARAAVDPKLATQLTTGLRQLHELFTLVLNKAADSGQLAADIDPASEAAIALGLLEGLSQHTLMGLHTTESTLAAIDVYLEHILPSERQSSLD